MKNAFVRHLKKLGAGLIIAGATTMTAHAEYYIVYPASMVAYQPCGTCGCKRVCTVRSCCACKRSCHVRSCYSYQRRTNVEYIYSHAPRAHSGLGTGEVTPYAWIPYTEAP